MDNRANRQRKYKSQSEVCQVRVLFNNLIDSGSSYTANNEDPNYPLSNLYDTRLSREFRNVVVSTSDYVIMRESSIAPTYVALLNHNISSSATIYVEASSSSGFGGAFSTTIAWSSYTMLSRLVSTAKEYWRIRVDGNSTANTHLGIGSIWLSEYIQMPGMSVDQELGDVTTARNAISDSGQLYGDNGYNYRTFKVNFPYLSSAQRYDMSTVWHTVKNYKPIIMDIWPNSPEERVMYCFINQDSLNFQRTDDRILRWKTSINFREVF